MNAYEISILTAGKWVSYSLVEGKSRRKVCKAWRASDESKGVQVWKIRLAS